MSNPHRDRDQDRSRGRARPGRDRDDQASSRLSQTPRARQTPAGLDRARTRQQAPPRPSRPTPRPTRPPLPRDEQPHLPRAVRKEIDRVVGSGPRADDLALALSVGSDAIDVGRVDVALEALEWAKHEGPRVSAVREALGVARYLDGDYAGALTELQAYRRISGRTDQNHVVADCLRGLDRPLERVVEPLEELLDDPRTGEDRRAEAVIIFAAALADADDLAGARALLRQHLGRTQRPSDTPHDLRVRVLAAELADRAGDEDEAAAHRRRIAAADVELLAQADIDDDHGPDEPS